MKFKITILEKDSQDRERITKCETFDNKPAAERFIKDQKAKQKPYKIPNKSPDCFYEMSAL